MTLVRAEMKERLTKQVLTLVLFTVLVWYSTIGFAYSSPSGHNFRSNLSGGEERDSDGKTSAADVERAEAGRETERSESVFEETVDDLDWPEIIGE